jgi:tetratricopeptide (TPR) repeat protein
MGRVDEALLESRAAVNIEPLSPILNISYAGTLWIVGRYDEARRLCAKVLELEPRFYFIHWMLALIGLAEGHTSEAIETLRRTIEAYGPQPELLGTLGNACGRIGDRDAALDALRQINVHDDLHLAEVHVGLGDFDAALRHVEQLFLARGDIGVVLETPQFAALREDPRFPEMLVRIGFPDPRNRSAPPRG